MILIDKYAYCNKLNQTHPMEKFLFSMGTMMICLCVNSLLVSSLVVLLIGVLLVFRAGMTGKFYLQVMSLPVSFLFLSLLTILLDVAPDSNIFLVSYQLWGSFIGITEPGLTMATKLFFKAMAAVSCLYFLALTTPLVEIIALLRKMKIPELFLELMSLVYRFIFVLLETAEKIYLSQSSRLGYTSVKKGYNSLGHLVANLLSRAFKRSQALYDALEARCYNGQLRVMERKYRFSPRNIALIALLEIFLLVLANVR